MGLASALSTALTGLTAAETTIDVVGNNVANSNTVGFKSSDAVFATQFLQTQSLGSQPGDNTGGTNPRQIGLGTKVAEITPDFTQGTIEVSSNPLDLAIQGDGFFVVQGSDGGTRYTRNGQFKTNSENELTTITGQRVLGFGVDDNFQIQQTGLTSIDIPLGAAAVAQATENVFLEGTMTPTGVIGDTPGIIQSSILSDGSLEIPTNLAASNIAAVIPPDATTTTAVINGSVGNIDAGDYRYKIVFVDAEGNESGPSVDIPQSPAAAVTNAGNEQISLANIPQADGTTFVDRHVYRAQTDGDGIYYFVNAIGDATTQTYDDSVRNADLPSHPTLASDVLNEKTLDLGSFSYQIVFVDTGSGEESRPTALTDATTINVSGRRIRLDNIPQPATADFNAVRLYRTLSDDPTVAHQVVTLTGGETSYVDFAPDADISGNPTIDLNGPDISTGTKLVDLARYDGTVYDDGLFQEGTLSYTARKGGRSLAAKELTITASTDVQELIAFMAEAMGIQETSGDTNFPIPAGAGATITSDNRIQFVSNMGEENELDIGLSAFQITTAANVLENVSLPFTQTQQANGESAVTDFVVYDSLGIPLNVRLTVALESTSSASTSYRWFADSSDNDPLSGVDISVGTGVVTFDGEGNFTSASDSTVSIDRRNVSSASPLEFDLDFSQISGLAADESSVAASRQDGSGAGTLSSFIITESGAIRGVFSNGVSRDLGQIRLVRFANNAGLEQVGDNLYSAAVNSGLPVEGNPGEQGIGTISAGAVELSNTDIGQNLIELILASTQYRGGTRVITAVQQLLDELLNLRR